MSTEQPAQRSSLPPQINGEGHYVKLLGSQGGPVMALWDVTGTGVELALKRQMEERKPDEGPLAPRPGGL